MSVDLSANAFIKELNDVVTAIWASHAKDYMRENISYSSGGYGIMQREELRQIIGEIYCLKDHLEWLHHACEDISA